MNYKMTAYVLGKMLGVEALVLCIPAAVSLIYGETSDMAAFGITSAVLCVFFLLFGRKKPENGRIYGKDGLVIVAAAWILWSVFGALPFIYQERFHRMWTLCLRPYLDLRRQDLPFLQI